MEKPKDYRKQPFKRMVILGESTVEGGPWLPEASLRYADIVARLISACQADSIDYYNKGIGGNSISTRSPGYEASAKPSAMERYKTDVIDLNPDLFLLCYGLNDMRAAMNVDEFAEDMATIIRDVRAACNPMIVLTTVYYMTAWKAWPPFDKGSVELTEQCNTRIKALAQEYDCVLADVWAGESGADWLINPDGVHANEVGNIVIAGRVFEAIARHASGLSTQVNARDARTEWYRHTTAERAKHGDPYAITW